MKITVIGGGKIGISLIEALAPEGHDITLIDTDAKVIENAVNTYDIMGIAGNGANVGVQTEAGVNKSDLVVAVTSSDELNILCCIIAKKIGARHSIARIRSPEYSRQFNFMQDELGISMTVNPEYEAANEISRILRFPSVMKIETFAKGRVELAEMRITEGSPLDGEELKDIPKRFNVRILICAVQRGEKVIIPTGDFRLCADDRIHITASHRDLASFMKALGIYRQSVKSAFIVGGGRIAFYLARQLCETGISVKIVEQDEKRCRELCELLPKAAVVLGDGTDQSLLNEENLDSADACVSLTGIDEENIIVSMFASKLGVGKVITKVSKSSLLGILDAVGIESVISPLNITVSMILRYVRARQNTKGSSIQTLYRLVNNQVEALEFNVSPDTAFIGTELKELKLKPELLIACIIRGSRVIFPGGSDKLEAGDDVIVVTTNDTLKDLSDILK